MTHRILIPLTRKQVLRKQALDTANIVEAIEHYTQLQREMAEARKTTLDLALQLGLDPDVAKNHPSVISYLVGYARGRKIILRTCDAENFTYLT